MTPSLSPALIGGLAVFAAGLLFLGCASALLLLRAERGTRDEDAVRRLFRNSALPFLIQLLVRGIDLAFAMVFLRLLAEDKGALGDYNLAALLVSLYLATISEWGLGVLLTREVARDRAAMRSSFGTSLVLRLGLSLVSLPIALLVVAVYGGLHGLGVITEAVSARGTLLVVVLALTLLPSAVGGAVSSVFLAMERPIVPALANLLNNVLSTALRLAALLLGFGVVGVAWAALAATLVNAAVFAWLLRRDFGWPGWQWDAGLARMMLGAAFPLMLNSLLVGVFFRFDAFIIKAFLGSAAFADYDTAYKIAPLALILPPIVVNALFPRFSRQAVDDRAGLLRGYRLTLRLLLLGALPLAAMASLFAPALIWAIAGPEWIDTSAPVLALLVWFVPLSYINGITQYVLIALDRQGAITLAFAITALFNLLGNVVLVPMWGLMGAAAMTIASEIVLYLPFRRALHNELGAAPLWSLAWRPVIATIGAVAVMLALQAQPWLAFILGGCVYCAVLWLLRTFTFDDRLLVARLLGRT